MSNLSLFPKASRPRWIRTFLEYCDSRHSDSVFKGDRVHVCVFLDLPRLILGFST